MASVSRRERKAARDAVVYATDTRRPTALLASAVNVKITSGWTNVRWGGTEWQQEAWSHYDTCPEFHAGVNINANSISRARLFGSQIDPITAEPGTQPTDNADVVDIMSQLFGGPAEQGQMLAAMVQHLEVAGDLWALATDSPDLDGQTWEILSTTEVTKSGAGVMIEQINGIPRPFDMDNELLMRIWQRHPRHRWDADSPAKALLPVLRELGSLSAMVSATVKSRLSSAGILWIPEELTLPASKDETSDPTSQVQSEASGPDAWLSLLTLHMATPIKDPDSATAVVPMVAQVKGDEIAKIVHMEFGRDLDAMIEPLREACIKRLSVGMNLPPSILLGMETANHWTAWTITEDYAKSYLAPKLELICAALTTYYLRPALRLRGIDPSSFAVYFDIDSLFPRQQNIDNAKAAWEAGLLSEIDYMAALGFSVDQMADNRERARRIVTEILQRGNPQTLAELSETIAGLFPGVLIQPINKTTGALGAPVLPDGTPAPAVAGTEPTPKQPAAIAPPAPSTPSTAVGAGVAGA